ncbi:hypothetical protein [Fulvivirga lutea]|uniref:Lipoprotein n=1 Tax=Fulvivirga lutea TaxID=2810512 RepID=A0A975A0Y8_9BACT|nr:hypothetical protein [Fulvivirga lutea]QSE97869.1 hypothetical protein JR347_01925 [Fulvivirga lutea]
MKQTIIALLVAVAAFSCNDDLKNENAQLLSELDSLKIQIENDKLVSDKLVAITKIIDQIEKDKFALSINLETGINSDDYERKMQDIQNSIQLAGKKIKDLSKVNSTYASIIKKYEKEIAEKASDIVKLNMLVAQYQEDNQGLISKVDLQNLEIIEKNQLIETKQQELALIEAKVQELVKQAELTQAEAYFAKGEAYYLAATRTKLAPRKKQATLNEALTYFEQAEKMGITQATDKIKEIKAQSK